MSDSPAAAELPVALQRRNGFVFFINTALTYLVAPVFYVGVLHAAILKDLEASDLVANLPEAVYLWAMPLAVVIAWLWPAPELLRPMLSSAHIAQGIAGLGLAILFVAGRREWLVPALVIHAGVIGLAAGVRNMCIWELLGRGISPARRGWTLGWTFGLGPIFAVLGSSASQMVLGGDLFGWSIGKIAQPWSYVILFGVTGPTMLLAAALVSLAHVQPVDARPASMSLHSIAGGLRLYFLNPLILVTALGFLLTYGGTMIMNNVALYVEQLLDEPVTAYAGLQLTLRFGCKCLAGFALGWLVARIHSKASLLVTTATSLAGVTWALVVPGRWYLLSFGLLGAGELFFVYYLNYIVGCSEPQRIRENTAYTNLITVCVGFFPLMFGAVSDHLGLRSSFIAAQLIFLAALLLVGWKLPREPRRATAAAVSSASPP